jgi:serine/threonine protein phosphatase PrpC
VLTFFARAETKGLSPLALFDDAVWVDPARGEDIVMLAGAPSERAWAPNAARFVFSTWTAASDVRCEANSAEDALRWIHALGAVTPAPPPEAVALLRDALCDDRDAAWLAHAWSELLTRGDDRTALEGAASFRYGAAQRAGRRKSADTLLPADYQQDRWCVIPVRARGVEATLLALADGVSTADFGSGAGAAARAIASIEDAPRDAGDDVDAYLRALVQRAHEAVCAYADATRGDAPDESHAPASTLTLALLDREGRASIAWVGDTPAFGWDPVRRTLVPLTFAHQGQYDALVRGVDARSARDHEDGKRLVRCLGGERCDPSLVTWRFGRGGGVVLATDGLVEGFAEVTHAGRVARAEREMAERFAELCGRTRHLQVACEGLCALSDELDGHDNLTVVAAFAGELPAQRERDDAARAEKHRGPSNGALSGRGNHGRR